MKNEYYPQTVTHPGGDLREKLEELQMSPKEFAVRCNKPIKTISEVLNGKSAITPDMAIQFENAMMFSGFPFSTSWGISCCTARKTSSWKMPITQAPTWKKKRRRTILPSGGPFRRKKKPKRRAINNCQIS